jgi:hypothetical protein
VSESAMDIVAKLRKMILIIFFWFHYIPLCLSKKTVQFNAKEVFKNEWAIRQN